MRHLRRRCVAYLLLLSLVFAQLATALHACPIDGESALAYAKAQLDFGPRVPGTPAARQAGDWIIEQMKSRSDTVVVQSWTHTTKDGIQLPMRNIIARYRPDVKDRMDFLGMELNLQPMKEFDAFVEEEMKRWKVVLEKAGVLAK